MSDSLRLSFKVASTLTVQRIVALTAAASGEALAQTVSATANLPIGVTVDDVLDTTGAIAVQVNGIAKVFFNDTVTSGARVSSDSSGRGVPFTAATATAGYCGTLLGPSVAATGTIAEILINPGMDSTG